MYPSGNAGGASASANGAVEAEVKKEKDVFTIKLGAVDAKAKIKIIKEVRTITGLGLKEVTTAHTLSSAAISLLFCTFQIIHRQKIWWRKLLLS